jgi:ferric-dicitrate binding protein FerR (iron transport regulator)
MSNNDNIINLIAKQLHGVATEQEAGELQLWLQSDVAHQQEYNELVTIWQKTNPLQTAPPFNTDIAWQQLATKIARSGKQPGTVISLIFIAKRVAAAVAILAMAAGGYWWYQHNQWQTFTASNNNEQLTLPDQSVVSLRKGSSLQYPKTFDKKERLVQLNGEAFFQVQHNEHQPFKITTANAEVKVLGTSFLVNSVKTEDEVVVVTGKVNVKDRNQPDNQVTLTPGERVVLQQDHFYENQVSDTNFLAWKTGSLDFRETPLQQVLQDLSHYYGIQVGIEPSQEHALQSLKVTVHFDNQPLEQALDEIRLITGLNMKKEKDKVVFYQK